jgi:hypothetical protein
MLVGPRRPRWARSVADLRRRTGFIRRLGPDAIDVLIDLFARRPSQYAIIGLQQMHGAAARVSPAATAFAHCHD